MSLDWVRLWWGIWRDGTAEEVEGRRTELGRADRRMIPRMGKLCGDLAGRLETAATVRGSWWLDRLGRKRCYEHRRGGWRRCGLIRRS